MSEVSGVSEMHIETRHKQTAHSSPRYKDVDLTLLPDQHSLRNIRDERDARSRKYRNCFNAPL